MKCNLEWLSAYLDGVLAEDKRAKLEEHLKTCEACTAKLEEFARVEQTAKKIPAPQLSEAYWENFANRVQNKLTIREKQKTSPGWLEALKSFFQPTTGKLAIAGSVAVLILLTFISLDQWKKQTFRPPVFEAEKPVAQGKVDSVRPSAKDELAFRAVEKDNKEGLVEDKRLDQPTRERGTVTLSQRPAENAPAASAPVGRALAAPEGQKSNEEPSLAAFAERDEAVKGDKINGAAGKKAEETEKVPLQNRSSLRKRSLTAAPIKGQAQFNDTADTKSSASSTPKEEAASSHFISKKSIQEFTLIKEGLSSQQSEKRMPAIDTAKAVSDSQQWSLIRGAENAQYGGKARPAIDTARRAHIDYTRKKIKEFENELRNQIPRARAESIYVFLGSTYLNLCYNTLLVKDWKTANRRINDFLKKELSDYTRNQLLQIQGELKKLKK